MPSALLLVGSTASWLTGGDVTSPFVVSVVPADDATDVAIDTTIVVTFDEPMDDETVTTSTFTVSPEGGDPVDGEIAASVGDTVFTFTPDADLGYATTYDVVVTSGAEDASGNPLLGFGSSFMTASAPPAEGGGGPAGPFILINRRRR